MSHYEPVTYDHEHLARSHSRARRSVTNNDSNVHVAFNAHGHHFSLRLRRDLETFSNSVEVLDGSGNQLHPDDVDTSHVYHGHIIGESFVIPNKNKNPTVIELISLDVDSYSKQLF